MTVNSSFKSLLRMLTVVVASTLATAGAAHADNDLAGSYRGYLQGIHDKTRVDLVLHSLSAQNREGSYLAILFQNDPLKVAAYLVDPLENPNHYSMVPREITADGQIEGVNNPDPSLELIVNSNSGSPSMTIVDANSSNTDFFQGSILFDGHEKSDLQWLDLQPGTYRIDGYTVSVPNPNSNDQVQMTLTLPSNLSGNFILRSGAPDLYTLKAVSSTAIGDELERFPRKIGVFIQRGHEVDFLFVDPSAYDSVLKLKRK